MTDATSERVLAPEADLGMALAALLRRYLEGAHAATADLPGSTRGYQVLTNATTDDCSNQATLAQRLGIDRTVMTYLVDDLESAGLVERRPDPADRRARQVLRTSAGDSALAEAGRRIRAVEDEVLAGLPAADAQTFRRLLAAAAADAPPVDHSMCGSPPEC